MHPANGGGNTRVGYVLKVYPRYSETFVVNEILAHEAAGLEIEIFSLRPPSDSHFQDVISRVRSPVTYLPTEPRNPTNLWERLVEAAGGNLRGSFSLEFALRESMRDAYQALLLADAVRSRGIGHLHAHFASAATTVARLAARFAGVPYTFTAHAKDIFHESVDPVDLARKLSDAAAVVTVSDYNVRHLRDTFGTAADRVRRVYNGIDTLRFPFADPADRDSRIVAVGRLVEKKGFSDLIDGCRILRASGREFQCDIVGGGPLMTDLQSQVDRLELADHVRLLGPRPQSEVAEYIRNAAVFAAPCVEGADGNRDGLPTVLLESMALGAPCISTDVTGIPEIVRTGETGILIPQRDPGALAEAIGALLDDSDLRSTLARRARRLIETDFDVHENARQVRSEFRVSDRSTAEAA